MIRQTAEAALADDEAAGRGRRLSLQSVVIGSSLSPERNARSGAVSL